MAAPKWFDYATYKANKLAQLQEIDSSWTMTKMEDAFTKAGFTGTDGYFAHFQKYGHTEDVSPNKLFSAEYYYKAKALNFYTSEAGGSIDKATVTAKIDYYADQVKGLINNAGMDAWTHYIKYGTAEGINPSNDFDTSAYMAAKLEALQAAQPDAGWDEDSMYAAFKSAGVNALSHFMQYAGNGNEYEVAEGIAADGTVPSDYAVPAEEQIADESQVTNFVFTAAIDKLAGTNADDVFSGDAWTVTSADSADGKGGTDTFDYFTANPLNSDLAMPALSHIENVNFNGVTLTNGNTYDASKLADVTSVSIVKPATMADGATFTLTTGSSQALTLNDVDVAHNAAAKINLNGASAVTLDNTGKDKTNDGDLTLDIQDSAVTALTVTNNNNASDFILANTGAKVASLAVKGNAHLAVETDLASVKSVDASGMTAGGIEYSLIVNKPDPSFKFTGSSVDDELSLVKDGIAALTSGDQLDGGNGKDKLSTADTTFDYADLAKVKGFEVLGLKAADAAVNLDASKIGSTFTEISVDDGNAAHTITNLANGFTVDVTESQGADLEITPKATGQTNITINWGESTNAAGITASGAGVTATIGFNNVTLHSLGKEAAVLNKIATLKPVDGSTYTIDGDASLEITNVTDAATAASKYDATNLKGAFTIKGNQVAYSATTFTKLGDTIIGGAGDDKITASKVGGELTGNDGKDTFDVKGSVVANVTDTAGTKMVCTTITDFEDKGDAIQFLATSVKLAAKATTLKASDNLYNIATKLADEAGTDGVTWGNNGTDTYVFSSDGTDGLGTADVLVKLSGVVDLSDATLSNAGLLTHA